MKIECKGCHKQIPETDGFQYWSEGCDGPYCSDCYTNQYTAIEARKWICPFHRNPFVEELAKQSSYFSKHDNRFMFNMTNAELSSAIERTVKQIEPILQMWDGEGEPPILMKHLKFLLDVEAKRADMMQIKESKP